MKTCKRVMLAIVTALIITSLPAQATRQDRQEKAPCPTPTPEPVVYSMAEFKPKILHHGKTLYTAKAKEEKIEGKVILQVVFHESGRITNIAVIKELPHGLTEQAIGTAYRIKFTPAMKDGKPVSVRGSLVYNFDLY